MNKLVIGTGLSVLAIYALGTFILSDKNPTQESKLQSQNKIISVRYMDEESTAASAGSQMAYLDPVTGELTSKSIDSFESSSSLQPKVNLPPVKITTYSNGMVKADLNGRFRTPLVATINCDGKLTTEHSSNPNLDIKECEAEQ